MIQGELEKRVVVASPSFVVTQKGANDAKEG
jgi:hypothetical protein